MGYFCLPTSTHSLHSTSLSPSSSPHHTCSSSSSSSSCSPSSPTLSSSSTTSPLPTTIKFLDLTKYHADPELDQLFEDTGYIDTYSDHLPFDPITTPSCFDDASTLSSLPSFDDDLHDIDPTCLSILNDELHPHHTSPSLSSAPAQALNAMTTFLHQSQSKSCHQIYQLKNIYSLIDPDDHNTQRAHIDGGSMTTTCHDPDLIYHLCPIPPYSVSLNVADNKSHYPTHKGYLCL